MSVPIVQSSIQGLYQFVDGLEAPTFESQRAQLLPPGLDQVQPTSILGDVFAILKGTHPSEKCRSKRDPL